MSTATPVADAIRAMQDRLGRPEWWCKETLDNEHGAVCIRGAQSQVVRSFTLSDDVTELLSDLVEAWTGDPGASVSGFNDYRQTTHDDILLFLDAALDVAEAEGL